MLIQNHYPRFRGAPSGFFKGCPQALPRWIRAKAAFIGKKVEDLGFDSLWYHEHPILPVHSTSVFPSTGGEIPWTYGHFTEPYISLAMACAVTSRIKLGTGITLVPERNPLILAKEVAVLDRHSNGRFVFGVGARWNR